MLREGLRAELPEAFDLIARAPRPRVARTGAVWAALAGLGMSALLSNVFFAVVWQLYVAVAPASWTGVPQLREAIAAVTIAIGCAVALRAGGWQGAVLYALALAAGLVANEIAAAPGRALFCERSGGCPERTLLEVLAPHWPAFAGVAAGPLVARGLAMRGAGTNAIGEALGVYVAASALGRVVGAPFGGGDTDAQLRSLAVATAVSVAAALASGSVIVRRGRDALAAAVVACAFFLLLWIPSLVLYLPLRDQADPRYEWVMLAPAMFAIAFVLGAVVTAALTASGRAARSGSRVGPDRDAGG